MKRLLLSVILLCLPQFLNAQSTASISGWIIDSDTGKPLEAANLTFKNHQIGTAANNSGYFILRNIVPGTYTVTATYIGYEPYKGIITLEAGDSVILDIELKPREQKMNEVTVASQRQNRLQPVGTTSISAEQIKDLPSVFQSDVFRSLQLLPGVKATSDFSSGLYVRGGSPDQTLILLDQSTIYNPSHFFGFFSTFNPEVVTDVQLYKGGYPARYGGRLGSVLSISTKDGNHNGFGSSLTFGFLASSAAFEGPLKNGSWLFAVRRSTLEPLLTMLQQSYDNIPESFYFFDLNGKLNISNDSNKLSLSFYSGEDDLVFPFAEQAGVALNYGNQNFSSSWTHTFSEKFSTNLTVTGVRYFNFPSFDIATTPYNRSNNIFDFSLKTDFEYLPNSNHRISAGYRAGSLTLTFTDKFDSKTTFDSHIHSYYGSAYLNDRWEISEHWIASPGIRAAVFSNGNYLRLEPRFSLEYRASDRFRIQTAYGRYNQFLTLVSNEAFTGFDVWLTANEGVPPAYGNQYILGFKTIPWENYSLDMELYYRSMENLFEPDPFVPSQSGLPNPEIFRFGEGYAYGAELIFERKVGKLTGFIGYTFGVTRRKFPGFNLSLPGNSARYYPPKYDRLHDLNIVMEYQFGSRWSSTVVFNYATGQAFTEPKGRTAAFDFPTSASRIDQLLVEGVNSSRLPAYHRLDVSISRKGTFMGIGKAEWQIQVINAYSRRNIWFYRYNWDENPVEREAVQLLPVLPSISYSLEF